MTQVKLCYHCVIHCASYMTRIRGRKMSGKIVECIECIRSSRKIARVAAVVGRFLDRGIPRLVAEKRGMCCRKKRRFVRCSRFSDPMRGQRNGERSPDRIVYRASNSSKHHGVNDLPQKYLHLRSDTRRAVKFIGFVKNRN